MIEILQEETLVKKKEGPEPRAGSGARYNPEPPTDDCHGLNFQRKKLCVTIGVTPSVGIEPTTTWLKATRSTS
jgi:hypothetical protein